MPQFTHLHLHTQYSILDGASALPALMEKVKNSGMSSVAITDHGNMFGVKLFHKLALKNGIKPVLGCEVYVAKESRFRRDKEKDKKSDHLILLAKNEKGYHNLIKLVSLGWIEGFYRKPRIDFELLEKYGEGLIVSSACLAGAFPRAVLNGDTKEAENIVKKYKNLFGEDYYLEMQRHKTGIFEKDEKTFKFQETVNREIVKISQKLGVKYIATNDVHFINKEDAEAHDILIALSTGKDLDDPSRMQYSGEEYLKTPEEMADLFSDFPEAVENTLEITDKIEVFDLDRDPVMPEFVLPENFTAEADYLRYITYEGAKMRWGKITDEIKERVDFELDTIIKMGFPGYFLIVWDFLKAAREMNVSVGPGRGSAAGSAVAYCLRITDIDPIKYGLLFERFLNPDRISMPDIDIDFDEDGRERVLKWVIEKYGENRVANIITFGSMAAKSAIRDVARVLRLPLNEADRLAKLVPEKPGVTLEKAFNEVKELREAKESSDELVRKTLKFAQTLEGSVRHTGVHACGIIIGKDDLVNYIPLSTAKDSDLKVTQYDGKHVEDVGLLKMDFLGLKTLSIIKDAVENIKQSRGIDIDIDNIPFDDEKTFELYSKGETTGLFQFESDGMKKYLKELKPNRFDDLIAMNALYRPGPMDYIKNFIARKHGKEKIVYDLPEMEEYLKDTYGITVFQEQVMLLSQKLAGFTKGQADSLRKAMGKKIKSMMDELKIKFTEGCKANGHDEKTVEKIWHDWEKFAQYAFNKSHSTGYAYVSFQTAYLKAHFPAEYMSAVLSRNLSDIKKVSQFMSEARRMGLEVLLPDINESYNNFTVNKKGQIRFGMGGIKNVGTSAVEDIVKEREKNGKFKSFFDFIERVNLSSVNKRTVEALVYAGAFDELENFSRSQYFAETGNDGLSFIEECIKYGGKLKNGSDESQGSIFGADKIEVKKPEIPDAEEWNKLERLKYEKEVIGIYLSEHPLDEYELEIKTFCNADVADLANLENLKGKEIRIAAIIKDIFQGTTKNGKPYGSITAEGYKADHRLYLFGNDYVNFRKYFIKDASILITGKVQMRRNAKDNTDLEFKILNIELLPEIKNDMIKKLIVKVPIEAVSEDFSEKLTNLMGNTKGKQTLEFKICDKEKNLSLNLFSRTKKVKVNKALLNRLKEIPDIELALS
ncbi:MAG: DNA polymerase III subunit alpha [Chlorobi bacterium]|nr:DNA polymerase III subunit alpha [Chlorobiota bacterium]